MPMSNERYDIKKMQGEDQIAFFDLPKEFRIINKNDTLDQDDKSMTAIQNVFRDHPEAETLAILENESGIRSIYASNNDIHDDRYDPLSVKFNYVKGEKLIGLDAEVASDLKAYGVVKVMIPENTEKHEMEKMVKNRVSHLNSLDAIDSEVDWATQKMVGVDLVVKDFYEKPRKTITGYIPVQFSQSRCGSEIYGLLKGAQHGTEIPAEVFMYLAAQKTLEAGGDIQHDFLDSLKVKAWEASDKLWLDRMLDDTPLKNPLVLLKTNTNELVQYAAGTVLSVMGKEDAPTENQTLGIHRPS